MDMENFVNTGICHAVAGKNLRSSAKANYKHLIFMNEQATLYFEKREQSKMINAPKIGDNLRGKAREI